MKMPDDEYAAMPEPTVEELERVSEPDVETLEREMRKLSGADDPEEDEPEEDEEEQPARERRAPNENEPHWIRAIRRSRDGA